MKNFSKSLGSGYITLPHGSETSVIQGKHRFSTEFLGITVLHYLMSWYLLKNDHFLYFVSLCIF